MFCVALIKHTLQLTFLLCGEKIEVNDEKKLEVEGPVRDDGGLAWAGSGGDGQDHDTFFRLVL